MKPDRLVGGVKDLNEQYLLVTIVAVRNPRALVVVASWYLFRAIIDVTNQEPDL
jgi:hypothetical protein